MGLVVLAAADDGLLLVFNVPQDLLFLIEIKSYSFVFQQIQELRLCQDVVTFNFVFWQVKYCRRRRAAFLFEAFDHWGNVLGKLAEIYLEVLVIVEAP